MASRHGGLRLVVILLLVFTPYCVCPKPGKQKPKKKVSKKRSQRFVYSAKAIRTCNHDLPVIKENSRLSFILAPHVTKRTLNTFLNSGTDKLEDILNIASAAWSNRAKGSKAGKDAMTAAKVMMAIGSSKKRNNAGHAFIVTNSKLIAVLNISSTKHIHTPKKESVFIKIISTASRMDEIEKLMMCGYDGDASKPGGHVDEL